MKKCPRAKSENCPRKIFGVGRCFLAHILFFYWLMSQDSFLRAEKYFHDITVTETLMVWLTCFALFSSFTHAHMCTCTHTHTRTHTHTHTHTHVYADWTNAHVHSLRAQTVLYRVFGCSYDMHNKSPTDFKLAAINARTDLCSQSFGQCTSPGYCLTFFNVPIIAAYMYIVYNNHHV